MPNLSDKVKTWVQLSQGSFSLTDMHKELNVITAEGKGNLRVIMHNLVKDRVVERVGGKDGVFRLLDSSKAMINWENANPDAIIQLRLPFNIQKYVHLYSKNVVIVAGEVNSGKTAFLYNVAWLNSVNDNPQPIEFYTNNEASPEEIKRRLSAFEMPSPCPFPIFERYDNWADVIDPDKISIIDYLDMGGEALYLVHEEITKIQKRLNEGIAIIGLQLPSPGVTFVKGQKKYIHRDLGYGRDFSQMRASLYLSLWKVKGDNVGICKIVKAKNRAMPLISPVNMRWRFVIDNNGAKFTEWEQVTGEDDEGDFING